MNAAVRDALLIWLIAVNGATFALYGIDKRRAKKGRWRIPERTLLLCLCWGAAWAAFWVWPFFITRQDTGISA